MTVRHEQAAVHCADGYARAYRPARRGDHQHRPWRRQRNGRACSRRTIASSRVLMITGQSETRGSARVGARIHEAEHQLDMLRNVDAASRIRRRTAPTSSTRSSRSPATCSAAAAAGAVEIPIDLQYARATSTCPSCASRFGPQPDAAASAARPTGWLAGAPPLIFAGGGVVSARRGRRSWCGWRSGSDAPVLTSVKGRGSIPEDHSLALGANGDTARFDPVIAGADVVLAVGTRFQLGSNLQMALSIPGTLIHLDADPGVDRPLPPGRSSASAADAVLGLEALLAALGDRRRRRRDADSEGRRAARAPGRCRRRCREGRRHAAVDDTPSALASGATTSSSRTRPCRLSCGPTAISRSTSRARRCDPYRPRSARRCRWRSAPASATGRRSVVDPGRRRIHAEPRRARHRGAGGRAGDRRACSTTAATGSCGSCKT